MGGDGGEGSNDGSKTKKKKKRKKKKKKKKVQVEQPELLVDVPSEGGEETGSDCSVDLYDLYS